MFTRRVAMGLVASSLWVGSRSAAQPAVLFRKSASSLDASAPEMRALAYAIPAMRQSGFWDRLASIHSSDWHQHHSWLFLPWHRAFLYEFERAVRRLTYDAFRMPYLDWDADRIPALLYEEPFAHDGRTHGPSDSMRAFQNSQLSFRQGAPQPFDDFFGAPDYGGDDESYGHDLVHVFVGGDMGNIATAPRDPIFYFHHANVDRLWWYWAQQYDCRTADCYPDMWLSERLHGILDPDGTALAPVEVRSLLSTTDMGYDYQNLPMVMMAVPEQALRSAAPQTARRPYTATLRFLTRPAQSATLALPRDLVAYLLTASRADVDAKLFVRSSGTGSHEIRISLVSHESVPPERIFAMPMGTMGASYVKNIGGMLASLAAGSLPQAVQAQLANGPVALHVEAIALNTSRALLTECTLKLSARAWE